MRLNDMLYTIVGSVVTRGNCVVTRLKLSQCLCSELMITDFFSNILVYFVVFFGDWTMVWPQSPKTITPCFCIPSSQHGSQSFPVMSRGISQWGRGRRTVILASGELRARLINLSPLVSPQSGKPWGRRLSCDLYTAPGTDCTDTAEWDLRLYRTWNVRRLNG